jgi:ABC-type transport system involved in cytochrome bd biosynthesis fused ATPase/permease subunit
MTSFNVPKLTFQALCQTGCIYRYGLFWMAIICLELVQNTLMANILVAKGEIDPNTKSCVSAIILIIPVVRFGVFGNYISNLVAQVQKNIWKRIMMQYQELTTDAKASFPVDDFTKKMDYVEWSFSFWIESGFPTVFNFCSMLYFCVYTFAKTDTFQIFFCLLFGTVCMYFLVKQKLDKNQAEVWDKTHKKRENVDAKMKLNFPRFANGQRSLEDISSLVSEKYELKSEFDKTRNNQKVFSNSLKEVSTAVILLVVPDLRIATLLTVCMQFTNMVNNILGLMNQNTHAESEYAGLYDKLTKAQKNVTKYEQLKLTKHTVMDCSINRGNFNLVMAGKPLVMECGRTVLIQGASGSGKTSFLNAVLGIMSKTEGANIKLDNDYCPANYCNTLSLLFQGTNHKFSQLTFSEMFGTSDELLLAKILTIAKVDSLMDRMKEIASKNTTNNCEGDVVITIRPSWFNIPLAELGIISGGETRRIAIALQLLELSLLNKQILVLDEPEQGTDPPVAYQLIFEIVKQFKDKCMIIIISHLEKFGGHYGNADESGIVWDNKIFVANGVAHVN